MNYISAIVAGKMETFSTSC